ncbi:MAG: imidazoleglycerol-phosphate dehydratase HisB [Phycisphaerales bacterium]|jgi:imidazoleglycerol phosphate dehydratase HisB
MSRQATKTRKTRETNVTATVNLDGTGAANLRTGIGFLDHLVDALAKHSRIDISLACDGDLHIDDHHSVEDCGIVLGQALDAALGDRVGIARFGAAYAPLDEALARAVVDLSGRPYADVNLLLRRDMIGTLACENIGHFIVSLATHLRAAIHADVLKGDNDHHKAEAAFKALALALRQAVTQTGEGTTPSTKGVL